MSETATGANGAWSYRAGEWFAVFGGQVTVVLPPSERDRVVALWALVDGGAGFDEVLDALLASGLSTLPGFVLVSTDAGPTRVLLRGRGVTAQLVADGEEVALDGAAGQTWVERTVHDVTSLSVDLPASGDGDAAGVVDFPILTGLVRVARLDRPGASVAAPVDPVAADPVMLQPDATVDGADDGAVEGADEGAVGVAVDPVAEEPSPFDHDGLTDEVDETEEPDAPRETEESGEPGEPGWPGQPAAGVAPVVTGDPLTDPLPEEPAVAAADQAPDEQTDEQTDGQPGEEPGADQPVDDDPVTEVLPELPDADALPEPPVGPPTSGPPASEPPAWVPPPPVDPAGVDAPPLTVGTWQPLPGAVPPPPPPIAPPTAPPGDPAPLDHDGMTRAGAEPPAPPAPGIPGQPPAPAVTQPVAKLVVSDEQTVVVDRAVLIGRAPEARRFNATEQPALVTVPSRLHEISSTHIEVRPGTGADHGSAVVTDMGSTNGTVLVQPGLGPEDLKPGIAVQLIPGAVINLGDGVTIQVTRP